MRRGRACSLLHETWLGVCSCVMSTLLRRFLKPGDAGGWFLLVKRPLYRSVKICKVKRHGAYRKSTDVPYRNVRTVLVRSYHEYGRTTTVRAYLASTNVPHKYVRTRTCVGHVYVRRYDNVYWSMSCLLSVLLKQSFCGGYLFLVQVDDLYVVSIISAEGAFEWVVREKGHRLLVAVL